MRKAAIPIAIILAFLTGCGQASNDPGVGGVSAEDAKALDEAAAKLDDEAAQFPSK
jgi:outer membrane lipoprotein-sorting protein